MKANDRSNCLLVNKRFLVGSCNRCLLNVIISNYCNLHIQMLVIRRSNMTRGSCSMCSQFVVIVARRSTAQAHFRRISRGGSGMMITVAVRSSGSCSSEGSFRRWSTELGLSVEEETLQVEVPQCPQAKYRQCHTPEDKDIGRWRLRERVPIKLESYKQFCDYHHHEQPDLGTDLLTIPTTHGNCNITTFSW